MCLCVHFIGAYESETVRFKFLSEREMLSQKSLAVTSFAHITSKKTHEKQKRSIAQRTIIINSVTLNSLDLH